MIDALIENSKTLIPGAILGVTIGGLIIVVDVIIALHTLAPKRYHGSDKDGKLSYSPSTFSTVDLSAIVMFYIAKYLPWPLGFRQELKPDGSKDGIELPKLTLTAPLTLSREDFRVFLRALIEVQKRKEINELYQTPLLLVAQTTPLLLVLLSHPRCPIRPLGAVNTRNRFDFLDPALLCDPMTLLDASRARELTAVAEMRGPGLRRRRGVEFTVRVSVRRDGRDVLVQDLSFLQFLPAGHKPLFVESADAAAAAGEEEGKKEGDAVDVVAHSSIALDTRAPRLWAATSRDYNPIHVSPLLARLFGFGSSIAHGNHATALALQALDSGLLERKAPFALEVGFRKPMLLPAELDVQWRRCGGTDDGLELAISSRGKVNVTGHVRML